MRRRGGGFFAVIHRWRRVILPLVALFLFVWLLSRSNELNAPNLPQPTDEPDTAVFVPPTDFAEENETAQEETAVSSPTASPTENPSALSDVTSTPLPAAATLTATTTPLPTQTPVFTPTPTVSPTNSPTATLSPEPTATPDDTFATAVFNSSIFIDHDTNSEELDIVLAGESIRVLGRSPVGQWFFVESDEGVRGFTYSERYQWNGRFEDLPIVEE